MSTIIYKKPFVNLLVIFIQDIEKKLTYTKRFKRKSFPIKLGLTVSSAEAPLAIIFGNKLVTRYSRTRLALIKFISSGAALRQRTHRGSGDTMATNALVIGLISSGRVFQIRRAISAGATVVGSIAVMV